MKNLLFNSCVLMLISTSSILANPEFNSQPPTPDLVPLIGQHVRAGEVPEGLSASDWSSIQTQIAAGKYRAYEQADGGFASANPAHGWNIQYATDGTTTLQPRNREAASYQLGFRLEAVGYNKPQAFDRPQRLSADGTTVTYQWTEDLREWWMNSENGLEQWFELEQRPAGATAGQPLKLQLTLASDMSHRQADDTLTFASTSGTEITYSKLKAWDATGRELPARMHLAANGLSLLIEDQDARYPLTIDPTLTQQAYVKASNTGTGDQFGTFIALDGQTLAVGAANEDSNATGVDGDQANDDALNAGAVYVFTRSGTVWSQQAYLKASNTGVNDLFGNSVAISGDTLVVGAFHEASNATGVDGDQSNDDTGASGAAYVFIRSGSTWSQQAYLKASNTGNFDEFGKSVTISGDTLVVGAPGERSNATGVNGDQANNSAHSSGAAYVFTRSGATWSQQAYLKASNTGNFDLLGFSLDISGDTVVVGAHAEKSNATGVGGDETDNSLTNAGAAYVFTRSDSTWSQQAYLKASNTGDGDEFGKSIAVDGETLVVGAHREDSNATGVGGDEANDSAGDSGAAYVFTRSGSTWSQQAYLKASNTDSLDEFGSSVAIDGDALVVGALEEASNATGVDGDEANDSAGGAGAAYLFIRSGTDWSQQAYLKASNTASDDKFGYSVAVAGPTVAVGAFFEDSNATGVDGDQANSDAVASGAVYVFDFPRRVMVITQ